MSRNSQSGKYSKRRLRLQRPTRLVKDGDEKPAGVPLGQVIPRKLVRSDELVVLGRPISPEAERYRRLVSILESGAGGGERPPQVITVTSSLPGEGKTLTALNLSLAMAENTDRRVLLIDADLRKPSVSKHISPKAKLGLSDLLDDGSGLDHCLLTFQQSRLVLLPAGAPSANPLGKLRSGEFSKIIHQVREKFGVVIIDTPPSVPFADASVINQQGDGILLVLRSRKTPKSAVNKLLEAFGEGEILGTVLNDIRPTVVDRYYGDYYQYHYEPEE